MDYKDIKQSEYIKKGILNDIDVTVTEKPIHTRLGSTDRKGYTLRFDAMYMDKNYQAFVNIEPFYSEEETKHIIERTKEDAKHKLADSIYKDVFTNQHLNRT